MKSIREKAKEIYPALECDVSGTSENLLRRNGFQTGANYVLDAIENIIVNNYDNTYNIVRCLVDCIEQLKK